MFEYRLSEVKKRMIQRALLHNALTGRQIVEAFGAPRSILREINKNLKEELDPSLGKQSDYEKCKALYSILREGLSIEDASKKHSLSEDEVFEMERELSFIGAGDIETKRKGALRLLEEGCSHESIIHEMGISNIAMANIAEIWERKQKELRRKEKRETDRRKAKAMLKGGYKVSAIQRETKLGAQTIAGLRKELEQSTSKNTERIPPRNKIPEPVEEEIMMLLEKGMSTRQIASKLGVGKSTVSRKIKRS